MAQNTSRDLGKSLEMKICPKYEPNSTTGKMVECRGKFRAPTSGIWPGKIDHSYRNMLSGKFTMASMPYFGRILGSKCHPYDWKKTYNPTKITFNIFPLSKWQICGQKPPAALPGEARNQLIRNSKWK